MNRTIATLGVVGLGLLGATVSANAAPSDKITICHATHSASNPYVAVTISLSALSKHVLDSNDIVPANSGDFMPSGQNLTTETIAILDAGCKVVTSPVTPPATNPPVDPVVTPPVTPPATNPPVDPVVTPPVTPPATNPPVDPVVTPPVTPPVTNPPVDPVVTPPVTPPASNPPVDPVVTPPVTPPVTNPPVDPVVTPPVTPPASPVVTPPVTSPPSSPGGPVERLKPVLPPAVTPVVPPVAAPQAPVAAPVPAAATPAAAGTPAGAAAAPDAPITNVGYNVQTAVGGKTEAGIPGWLVVLTGLFSSVAAFAVVRIGVRARGAHR